ncbi:hypothetical protein [Winogradskyella tangerina]|uniref:hypothetical protein n=1 Tax=Winogradskyella tangerina TaxID=2023240 RepID=UPI000DBE8FAE|nr:hypothetical protein [Winogradskyella tangerina]
MNRIFLFALIFGFNVASGQVQNGLVKNTLNNFKANYYLTDNLTEQLSLFDYWFFIDYSANSVDDYLHFDERFNGKVKEIITKVYEVFSNKEQELKGERNETFNTYNQKLIVKDIENGPSDELSIRTRYYEYDANQKLTALKSKIYYLDDNQEDIEIENNFFKHYKDSIVMTRSEEEIRTFFKDKSSNSHTTEPLNRLFTFHTKNGRIIKKIGGLTHDEDGTEHTMINYNENGYEISGLSYFSTPFEGTVTHHKDRSEIEIIQVYPSYDMNVSHKLIYKYDEHQNIIRVKLYFLKKNGIELEKPELTYDEKFVYKYDKYNNWISKKHINLIKNKTFLYTREITY